MSPEQATLVKLLAQGLGLAPAQPLQVDAHFSWHSFWREARRQKVVPWLFAALDAVPNLPEGVRSRVERSRVDTATVNLLLANELCRLSTELDRGAVDYLCFKGPVAALQLHGSLDARPSGDIDLLVPQRSISKAVKMLRRSGYECVRVYERALQLAFARKDGGFLVDLHWAVPPADLRIRTNVLMARRRPLEVLGQEVMTPNQHDTLILASNNVVKEYWRVDLHALADVAVGLRDLPAKDWPELLQRAGELRARRILLAAVCCCEDVFGCFVPGRIRDDARSEEAAVAVSRELTRHLFRRPGWRTPDTLGSTAQYYRLLEDRPLRRLLLRCGLRADRRSRFIGRVTAGGT